MIDWVDSKKTFTSFKLLQDVAEKEMYFFFFCPLTDLRPLCDVLLYQCDSYIKLECTKRMGFWFLRREKTGILEPRAIKGSNHRLERPAYGVPEIRPGPHWRKPSVLNNDVLA